MPFLIGTDEAGYGPNLGPLVIGATLWRVPSLSCDLYKALAPTVAGSLEAVSEGQIAIADSKALYHSGEPMEDLERSVLAVLAAAGPASLPLSELVDRALARPLDQLCTRRTYEWGAVKIPVSATEESVLRVADRLRDQCSTADVGCLKMRATAVSPESFNQGLDEFGNKATLLSTETCRLAKELLDFCHDDVLVLCDKHGGRGHYAGLLQQEMTEEFVRVRKESRLESVYQWRQSDRTVEVRFMANGERFLPVALSSMLAKYLRELTMLAWNAFWIGHLPELKPTAGYPVDARRFKSDISRQQRKLGIEDRVIWRNK